MRISNPTNKLRAVLLCGGKGERLYPLTEKTPKPLVKINSKPILSYIIEHLKKYKIMDLIILTGYKSNKIKSYIEMNYQKSKMQIIDSGEVDIIERIKDALHFIDDDFLLLYGDTISNINIDNLINFHRLSNHQVTMSVWPLVSQFGVVEIDSKGSVLGFKEKPKLDKWINIGYFYFNKSVFNKIKKSTSFADLLEDLAHEGILGAFKHEGIHITVNTIKELTEAEKNISNIY
jgi:glucose-1-phosphate cytidylyltransferase